MGAFNRRQNLLQASALTVAVGCAAAAQAQEAGSSKINSIERQIGALQAELKAVKHQMVVHEAEVRQLQQQSTRASALNTRSGIGAPSIQVPAGYALVPATTNPDGTVTVRVADEEDDRPKLKQGQFRIGAVTVTLGGYVDLEGVFRTRNEVADTSSSWNGIPLPNSQLYHENEFRFSARQTRVSVKADADIDKSQHLEAYLEADFAGAAPTANSNNTNSYNPRMRHAFGVYENKDWGFYALAGQTWSLLTMSTKGIPYSNADMNIPNTVDQAYIPGFIYARQPGIRIAKSFANDHFWLAAAVENPQTVYVSSTAYPSTLGTVNVNNPGGSGFASTVNYSTSVAPDIIVKAAVDPGWGHFEAYGVATFEHDRVSQLGKGQSNTVAGGGGGGAVLLPIIPKILSIEGRVLAGKGIGRYGAGALPDAIIGPDGSPEGLTEVMGLAGIVAHPIPTLDIYAYGGTEQLGRRYYDANGKAYGYGNPLYNNSNCEVELATTDCSGNTSGLVAGALGAWWRFEKGPWGTMQIGPEYAYVHRSIYSGVGPTPKTDENIIYLSLRYSPFQ